jgi:hypothetical protein
VDENNVVTWSTERMEMARVYVSVNGGEEQLFAQGLSGSVAADFITPGNVYVFLVRSFDNDVVGRVYASVTVDRR